MSSETGPTGPAAEAVANTTDSFRGRPVGLDHLDQRPLETVADGLAFLRLSPSRRTPVWCLRTAEKLLEMREPTVGAPEARRKELERQLVKAKLLPVAHLEFALQPVIAEMERTGLGIDAAGWGALTQAAKAAKDSAAAAAADLGLTSPDDDAAARAALAARGVVVKSVSGRELAAYPADPLVQALLRYRKAAGIFWPTCNPVHLAINAGRVPSTFDPLGATTGRMSCSKPNLLSIPKDPAFRQCVVPRPGCRLVVADYSSIELRILAEITGDTALKEVFIAGGDPHRATAAQLFKKNPSAVSVQERQAGKAVNFGFAFGMGPAAFVAHAQEYGLAVTMAEAEAHRTAFLSAYAGIAAWQADTRRSKPGETRTLAGRRRLFESAESSYAERLNAPVQGTGADGLKLAMVMLHDRLTTVGGHTVLAVHDEILVEAAAVVAEQTREIVHTTMVDAMERLLPSVPVEVKSAVRSSWAEDA